jgi:hypothetical protein
MDPEIWVGIVAVFISGGAIGTVGTLLAQWVVRRIDGQGPPPRTFEGAEMEMVRQDLSEVTRRLHNVDARLDFQEQLLSGSSPTTVPPPRLEEATPEDREDGEDEEG